AEVGREAEGGRPVQCDRRDLGAGQVGGRRVLEQSLAHRHIVAEGLEDQAVLRLSPEQVGGVRRVHVGAGIGGEGEQRDLATRHVLEAGGQVVTTMDTTKMAYEVNRIW